MKFKKQGMDLTKGTIFLKFDLDTSTIIGEFFKEEEQINSRAVTGYLGINSKTVNAFNHSLDEYMIPYMQLKVENEKIYKLM